MVVRAELAGAAELEAGAGAEEEAGAAELASVDEAGAAAEVDPPLLASAAQAAWAAWRVAAASEVEHDLRTQLVAADWMAASLADWHWQAVSLAPQVVAELTAAAMQG